MGSILFIHWKKRSWLISLIVCLVVLLSSSSPAMARTMFPQIKVLEAEGSEIRNGDIIFRKASGLGSQYIMSVDNESDYSHTGIVHKVGNRITIIHSAPEQTLSAAGTREEPIESFLHNVPLAAIYRLREDSNGLADRTVSVAKTFIGVPFDVSLDMADARSLYCTELVWLSYKEAGIDLLDGHYDNLNVPILGKGVYILPSSLVNSRWLYQVLILKSQNSLGG